MLRIHVESTLLLAALKTFEGIGQGIGNIVRLTQTQSPSQIPSWWDTRRVLVRCAPSSLPLESVHTFVHLQFQVCPQGQCPAVAQVGDADSPRNESEGQQRQLTKAVKGCAWARLGSFFRVDLS
jgi:hypothetical protein